MNTDTLIDAYLHALLAEAQKLPGTQAVELVSDVREHLTTALEQAGSSDEATVRNILERLGTPEAIVAASLSVADASAGNNPVIGSTSMGPAEVAAVLLMSVGSVMVPVFGPLAGIYFARTSTKWPPRTKRRATWLGLLSAAWMPLFALLFLFAAIQRPVMESVLNLLPGVHVGQEIETAAPDPLAGCNVLQSTPGPSATTPDVHQALAVVSGSAVATVLPADRIPSEWLGTTYGDLVEPVDVNDSWRVLQRPRDGKYVGLVHISPSSDTPGWVTATVVAVCGGVLGN